jgi:ketosteroid isomerase-like protein
MLDAGVKDISLTTLEVEEAGNSAVEVGVISATAPGEGDVRVTLTGKYIVVWRRDAGGNWRLHRDIWNFDA